MPYQLAIAKTPKQKGAIRIARIESKDDPKYDGAYVYMYDDGNGRRKKGDDRPKIEFPLKQGYELFPYFQKPKERLAYHINFCGPTMCGKSTCLGRVLDQLIHIMPKETEEDIEEGRIRGKVIAFSGSPADEPIDRERRGYPTIRADLENPDLFKLKDRDEIEKHLAGNILVYDDTEKVLGKAGKFLKEHRSFMLENGRHYGIHCMTVSHDPKGGHLTKVVNSETNGLFCFPAHMPGEKLDSYLKTYYGLSDQEVDHIRDLESRWVFLKRNYPRYCVYETGAFMID